jgi:diguanylate cyclase (GGDEF)-like protein
MLIALNITAAEDVLTIQAKTFNSIAFVVMGLIFLHAIYKIYWQKVYVDELTAVANRRAFDEYLHKLGRKYAIAMIDIDNFKKFNDRYGHTEGDHVLRFVAKHLRDQSGTRVFRYGGEEFALVYRGFTVDDIFWHVDHMREKLANSDFYIRVAENIRQRESAEDRGKKKRKIKRVNVTISVGLAQRNGRSKIPHDVLNSADKALYAAKNKGKNVCVKAANGLKIR